MNVLLDTYIQYKCIFLEFSLLYYRAVLSRHIEVRINVPASDLSTSVHIPSICPWNVHLESDFSKSINPPYFLSLLAIILLVLTIGI